LKQLRYMFYLANPQEIMQDNILHPPQYVNKAIPMFIFFIIFEIVIMLLKKRSGSTKNLVQYNVQETICSISMGLFQQITDILLRGVTLFPYVYVYENFRLFDIPLSSMWAYVGLFLGVDLGYYWMHRCAHSWHFMWIGHSVHHSGEYYNLATALRQGTTQAFYSRFFYLPLAILGFPFTAYMGHNQLNTLYQFWIHTEAIDKLGIFEVFFNTPSHHRMHHRPPGNCNYAGVLIIWDRMFGTFVEEKERRDMYGLAKPLESFNPVFANISHALRMMSINKADNDAATDDTTEFNFSYFLSIFFTRRHHHQLVFRPLSIVSALSSSLGVALSSAAWVVPLSSPLKVREKYGTAPRNQPLRAVKIYTTLNFTLTIILAIQLLENHSKVAYYHAAILMIMPVWSLVSIGMLNECNPYSLVVETRRVLVLSLWLMLYALMQEVARWGFGHPSVNAVVAVKFHRYVFCLEAPFYVDNDLLSSSLCVLYVALVFFLWMATRYKLRLHYHIVRAPRVPRSHQKVKLA